MPGRPPLDRVRPLELPAERIKCHGRIERSHLGQQRTVHPGVRQLISAAEYMGELVAQTHRGAARAEPASQAPRRQD